MLEPANGHQLLLSLDLQLSAHSYQNAQASLKTLTAQLSPALTMKTIHTCDLEFAQNIFKKILPYSNNPNQNVREAINKFLSHWSYLISSAAPLDFLQFIQEIAQKRIKTFTFMHIILPSIAHALSLIGDDKAVHFFPFIMQLLNAFIDHAESEIPDAIWEAVGKFAPDEEIKNILTKSYKFAFASKAAILIKKNQQVLTNVLFKNASTDYLNEFFKYIPPGYDIDYETIIERISTICDKLGNAGFNSTCLLLGTVIKYNMYTFSEDLQTKLKTILEKVQTFLSAETIQAADTSSILHALLEGCKKDLFDRNTLKTILTKINITGITVQQLLISYLLASIYCLEKDGDNTDAFRFLLRFGPWYGPVYNEFIETIQENYNYIKDKEPRILPRLLFNMSHPLPKDPSVAIPLIKFFQTIPQSDLTNPLIDINFDNMIISYLELDNPILTREITNLAKLYKYCPPLSKIDLFGQGSDRYIELLANVRGTTLKEIIMSQLVDSHKRYSLFSILKTNPTYYRPFSQSLIEVLYEIVRSLGLIIDMNALFSKSKIKQPEFREDFITEQEIQELFGEIDGPLSKSSFGLLLQNVLDSLTILIKRSDSSTFAFEPNSIGQTALISSLLCPICPKYVLRLITVLYDYKKEFPKSKNLAMAFDLAIDNIKKAAVPIKYSVDIAKFAYVCGESYQTAYQWFPDHIHSAVAKSRDVADLYKEHLQQPLQPMPTFLSFVEVGNHKEWASICAEVINPYEWELKEDDERLIKQIEIKNEDIKTIILSRIQKLKDAIKPVQEYRQSYVVRAPTFIFNKDLSIPLAPKVHLKDQLSALPTRGLTEPTIVKPQEEKDDSAPPIDKVESDNFASNSILLESKSVTDSDAIIVPKDDELPEDDVDDKKIGKFDSVAFEQSQLPIQQSNTPDSSQGTLYEITSFLWHSTLPLPESIKPEDLEQLAFSYRRNVKYLIGFFSWASQNKYKINLHEWSKKLLIRRFTRHWLLAFALFLSNIHCTFEEIPYGVSVIIRRCLTSFGCAVLSRRNLIFYYQTLTGVEWLIVRNIIAIDPPYFKEFPVVVAEITHNMDSFKKYLDSISTEPEKINSEAFLAINNIIFEPKPEEMIQRSIMPTNRTYVTRLLCFKEIAQLTTEAHVQHDLLESLISALSKSKRMVSNAYLSVFMNIKMTPEQLNRVKEIFFQNRKATDLLRKFMMPALFISELGQYPEDETIRFFHFKPPSFTRAFFRSLLCPFAPPINQQLIKNIVNKHLLPVFPALAYTGYAKNGIKMWESATPLSKLRCGYMDPQIGAYLLNDMKIPCEEAIFIYKYLYALSDDDVARGQAWATRGMIREEIARTFLDACTSVYATSTMAEIAVDALCQTIGIENAMVLIGNKDFLAKPNFLAALTALLALLHKAEKLQKTEIVDFLKLLLDPETAMIEDENRAQILSHLNETESISKLIHQQY